MDEQEKILYDEKGNPKKLDPVESKEFRQLQKKLDYLENLRQNSICKCATCSATDKNMVFNPVIKAWFCTRCYHFNKEFYKYSDPHLYP